MCYIGDASISCLLSQGKITSLNLAESLITDASLKALATHCSSQVSHVCICPLILKASTRWQHSIEMVHAVVSQIEELDLSWCEEVTTEGLFEVVRNCSQLTLLYLRQLALSEELLMSVARQCTQLRHVDLTNTHIVCDSHLIVMSLHLKQLETLDLSWNLGKHSVPTCIRDSRLRCLS